MKSPPWLTDLLLLVSLSVAALALSGMVVVGGKEPLDASALAVIGGILLRTAGLVPRGYRKGVRIGELLLGYGIVFLGASLDFGHFLRNGLSIGAVILVTMVAGYLATVLIGRLLGLSSTLLTLLAVGTTICGGTAIAVVAPLLGAPEEETSYAIGTITLWGVVALLCYPLLAGALAVSDATFGLFAGVAIHSTPQVVGAGYVYSELAGKTATAVKLVRNCFIAPLALLFAFLRGRSAPADTTAIAAKGAFPWFLFGFFLLAALNTGALIPASLGTMLSSAARFLIVVGMADVGLSTDLNALRKIGPTPLLVGLLGALAVAAVAVLAIRLVA